MNIPLGFDHGAIAEEEWKFVEDQCKILKVKTVIEVGSGFSTICFSKIVDHIDSYETETIWIDRLTQLTDRNKVTFIQYKYPDFPQNDKKYDIGFVDGPAGGGCNGRKDSMIFVKPLTNYIFIHDFGRKMENQSMNSVFLENGWEFFQQKRRIILIKKKE